MGFLIIDDNCHFGAFLGNYLVNKKHWAEVQHSVVGAFALLQIKSSSCKTILISSRLPGKDIIEVISLLKERYPHIPIILYSCIDSLADLQTKSREAGVDYVCKAIGIEDMYNSIVQHISRFKNKLELKNSSELQNTC